VLRSYVVGLAALVLLVSAWVGIQRAWRRHFPAADADGDALVGRSGCGGCARVECEDRAARSIEEEVS
jgi:hypothetical protein